MLHLVQLGVLHVQLLYLPEGADQFWQLLGSLYAGAEDDLQQGLDTLAVLIEES